MGRSGTYSARCPTAATVSILTNKDPQALDVLRHSSAHALATAVRQLFPQAQIGFGPPIEDGFYYDFDIGAAVYARGYRGDRKEDGGGSEGRLPVRPRRSIARRGQETLQGRSAEARAHR